jgi:putative transposase
MPIKGRKSPRLKNFDYSSPGAYFVTICVNNRELLLSDIREGEIFLNRAGKIASEIWQDLPNHYPNIKLDDFIFMPNHVHGLLWIIEESKVRAGFKPALTEPKFSKTNNLSPPQNGLSEIVRGFKPFSSLRINVERDIKSVPFWQRSFHEHIICNEDDLDQHRLYIQNNPQKWALDKYNL